jgi:hypothetical protein
MASGAAKYTPIIIAAAISIETTSLAIVISLIDA